MNPLWSLPIDYKPSSGCRTWDAPHVRECFQKSIVYFSKLFYFTEQLPMPSLFELWLSSVPTFFLLLLTMLTLCRKVPVLNMTSLSALRCVSLGCRVLTHVRIQPCPVAGPCRETESGCLPPLLTLGRVCLWSHSADTSGASSLEFLPAGLKPAVPRLGRELGQLISSVRVLSCSIYKIM